MRDTHVASQTPVNATITPVVRALSFPEHPELCIFLCAIANSNLFDEITFFFFFQDNKNKKEKIDWFTQV